MKMRPLQVWEIFAVMVCCLPLCISVIEIEDIVAVKRISKHFAFIWFAIPVFLVFTCIYQFRIFKTRTAAFHLADWLFLLYIIYILLRGNEQGTLFHGEKIYWYIGAGLFYFVFKELANIKHFKTVSLLLIISTLLYHTWDAGWQLYNYSSSTFRGHITSTFFNPSLMGAYFAAIFPLLYAQNPHFDLKWKYIKEGKLVPLLATIGLCAILIILPSTLSRAAWIGALLSSGYVFFNSSLSKRAFIWLKQHSPIKIKHLQLFGAIVLIGSMIGIYHLKKDSANGRILIWQTTSYMWARAPMFGHGWNTVDAQLLNYQADYLRKTPDQRDEQMLAGNVHWSFNEVLQMGAELGMVGVLLFFGVLLLLLLAKPKAEADKQYLNGAKGTMIAITCFGMFSYPFYSPVMFLLLMYAAGVISTHTKGINVIHVKSWLQYIPKVIIIIVMIATGIWYSLTIQERYKAYWLWDEALDLYRIEAYEEANKSYKEAYAKLKHNGKFLLNYGKSLALKKEYAKALEILQEASPYWSDKVYYTTLGDIYKAFGEIDRAEQNYEQASWITPHKFYPHYLLFKLYIETNQTKKALKKAKYIALKPIKIHTRALEEIYEEINKDLEANDMDFRINTTDKNKKKSRKDESR